MREAVVAAVALAVSSQIVFVAGQINRYHVAD